MFLRFVVKASGLLFKVSNGDKTSCVSWIVSVYISDRLMEIVVLKGFHFISYGHFTEVVTLKNFKIISNVVLDRYSLVEISYFGTSFWFY